MSRSTQFGSNSRGSALRLLGAIIAAVCLAWATPLGAQLNTGTIEVMTADENATPLPGVTIEVRSAETGFRRTGMTDALGSVTLLAVPPGTYQVGATLEGFSPISKDEVVLRIGQTARLRFTLSPQTSEMITVTAEIPVVDVLRTDTSTNIVPEQIRDLPVQDRDFEKLAFIAPGVQRERGGFRFIENAPVIGGSGNASQASILVDGVDFTDQALGLARARFSQDAIGEFRVINSRFDAEIGGSAASALSVVTKSGTNDVAGSVFAFYRDDSLREKKELAEDESTYERFQVGATVGGPVSPDKSHYFLSFEYVDESDVTLFRPQGAFVDLAEDLEHPFDQTLALGSFNHQFGPTSSGQAKLVYERYREENFRVGGVAAESNGQQLNRDNWNLTLQHTKVFPSGTRLNEARFQYGQRDYDEPTNSQDVEEWFSGGATLQIGNNVVGDLLGEGDYWELRDTFHWSLGGQKSSHDLKAGASIFNVGERSDIPVFQEGLFIYATDSRLLPIAYAFGVGSADVTVDTDLVGVFIQDDWRARENLTVSLGLRYDYDTDGNNPDFTHSLVGERSADSDNFQPRLGFSWDMNRDGRNVLRGGAGFFTGRYLLVPAFTELQQNGESGRVVRQNLNGLILGLPPIFWLDPNNPENSGIPLNPDISLMEDSLQAPEAVQASLGYTRRLGQSGLYLDIEAIYADGDNEIVVRDTNWGGNDNPTRPNPSFNQINTYTNDGHSEYSALVVGVNGTIKGGHLITSSVTYANKENIADDFSPVFPTGYPSDPANIENEFGNSRGVEDYRVVLAGVFRIPWNSTLAPIFQYGSGQYWNRILGYDFNGDGKNSDRLANVRRNDEDGPDFKSFSLRWTKTFDLGDRRALDLIVEGFNLFNTVNYDVNSVDKFEFLGGPTLANPSLPFVPNPNFGNYSDTLAPREIQLGLRFRY